MSAMDVREQARPTPKPSPETAHFWQGAAEGVLRLQRCRACDHVYFPPQPFCPRCSTDDVEIMVASGRATLYSYVISHLPTPGFSSPFVLAVVELSEGPRLLTNIVGVEPQPELLSLDMDLEVVFEPLGDLAVPLFRPATIAVGA
ncbi:MAG: Zn-ribbon domain-containing OB-fold protein [Acidimicrobiia bacterium]